MVVVVARVESLDDEWSLTIGKRASSGVARNERPAPDWSHRPANQEPRLAQVEPRPSPSIELHPMDLDQVVSNWFKLGK